MLFAFGVVSFRADIFNHMAEFHHFNVGHPDNLGASTISVSKLFYKLDCCASACRGYQGRPVRALCDAQMHHGQTRGKAKNTYSM